MSNKVTYVEDEPCPQCGYEKIILHDQIAMWECERCRLVWAAVVKKGYFQLSLYNGTDNQSQPEERA